MGRVEEGAKARLTADEIIRPRQAVLVVILLAYGSVVGLVIVGALRSGEVLVAWVGVAFAVVFLPVVEFYRRGIAIEPGALVSLSFRNVRRIAFDDVVAYGIRRGYVYKSGTWSWLCVFGRDGARIDIALDVLARQDVARIIEVLRQRAPRAGQIDPPRDRLGARLYVVLGAGIVLIALGLVVLGIVLPPTLEGQRLFSEAAALGLIAGAVVGTAAAPPIVPRAPIAVVVIAILSAMVLVPAGALAANMAMRAPLRTTGLTVLERKVYADDHGRAAYRVDVDIDRVQHRLSPGGDVGRRLEQGRTFDICVRDGVLGYTVVLSYTNACGDATRAPRR